MVFLVVRVEGEPLSQRAVSTNGREIEHAKSILHESASLDGNIQICNVVENIVHQFFEVWFAKFLGDRPGNDLLPVQVSLNTVLAEDIVNDVKGGVTELLVDLREVRARHDSD